MNDIIHGKKVNNGTKNTLDQWLKLIHDPPDDEYVVDCHFPTDEQKNEFIARINEWSDEDIYFILKKFLMPSGSLGIDDIRFETLVDASKNHQELFLRMIKFQYFQRLVVYQYNKSCFPWEGITWILDLLPHFPREAINALDAYIFAHIQLLPDNRLDGHWDALEIIKARYIGFANSTKDKIELLLNLSPREFEILVQKLYEQMDYETELTKSTRDGGRDIHAKKTIIGKQEYLRIECKRYSKPPSVRVARELLGVVSAEKVNKGVLITTSAFTKPTKNFAKENPRIELIDGPQLVLLLNEFQGTQWPIQLTRIIREKTIEIEKTDELIN